MFMFTFLMFLIWIIQCKAIHIQLEPIQVVLMTHEPQKTSITCTTTGTSKIKEIFSMQIKRKRPVDPDFVALVEVTLNNKPAFVDTITEDAKDIENRTPNFIGEINNTMPSLSNLKMELNTNTITCQDVAEFQCVLVFKDTSNHFLTETASANLKVYALPEDLSVNVTKRNSVVTGGTVGDPANFNVSEVATISCTGKIGSDNTTSIRWRITSDLSGTNNFIDYNPPAGTGSESQPSDFVDCSYSRTATINYTMTAADANRQHNLIIQCYISVNPPGQEQYEIPNSPMFYIDVVSGSEDNGTESHANQITACFILSSIVSVLFCY